MICIEGVGLRLRPTSSADAAVRLSLGNDPAIMRMFGVSRSAVEPMTMDLAESWAQGLMNDHYAWVIEVEGRLIGEIKLHAITPQDRRASMAIAIYASEQLGKGHGSHAIRLLLRHAFTELNLHRVGVRVLAYNERAIRAYQKCGFVIEGRERETAYVDGVWYDDLMMGILAREFQPESDRSGPNSVNVNTER